MGMAEDRHQIVVKVVEPHRMSGPDRCIVAVVGGARPPRLTVAEAEELLAKLASAIAAAKVRVGETGAAHQASDLPRDPTTGATPGGPLTADEARLSDEALLAFADCGDEATVALFREQAYALERRLRHAESRAR
jgi:hypothetical protein